MQLEDDVQKGGSSPRIAAYMLGCHGHVTRLGYANTAVRLGRLLSRSHIGNTRAALSKLEKSFVPIPKTATRGKPAKNSANVRNGKDPTETHNLQDDRYRSHAKLKRHQDPVPPTSSIQIPKSSRHSTPSTPPPPPFGIARVSFIITDIV